LKFFFSPRSLLLIPSRPIFPLLFLAFLDIAPWSDRYYNCGTCIFPNLDREQWTIYTRKKPDGSYSNCWNLAEATHVFGRDDEDNYGFVPLTPELREKIRQRTSIFMSEFQAEWPNPLPPTED
jgi:hypothetical protein